MLVKEQNYDFRKRLLQVHQTDIRVKGIKISEDEIELINGSAIVIPCGK